MTSDSPVAEEKTDTSRAGHTPLMRQYYRIRERHPGAILLFRMGDFYETFDSDAIKVSEILGITLTKRANGKAADVPLAGFPHHALDTYLPKLVRAGERVAICEQLEDPSKAKKLVRRDVVEIVTPGVSFRDQLLQPREPTYLATVFRDEKAALVGLAFIDASTGEFGVAETSPDRLEALVQSIRPAEIVIPTSDRMASSFSSLVASVTRVDDWVFTYDYAYETLVEHFKTHSLKGFGVEDLGSGIVAAGAALHYLRETQQGSLPHIRRIVHHATEDYMLLDPQTQRNLELVSSVSTGVKDSSLVSILDATRTAMGGRRLRRWFLRPLRRLDRINERLDAVEALRESGSLRDDLRGTLSEVGDLERLAARVCTGRAGPRELVQLKKSLGLIPQILELLEPVSAELISDIRDSLDPCSDLVALIDEQLVDDPPAAAGAGGLFRTGCNDELDELREITRSSKEWLARLQKSEAERTGIPSLKIGYNKVFGYYLEVTNTHRDKVPDEYIRKQTLVNAERYITPELKEFEEKILSAEDRIVEIETTLFAKLRDRAAELGESLQRNAEGLARLDCLSALAQAALDNNYVRPSVDDSRVLEIVDGRHPVVEKSLPLGEPFIPNSLSLDPEMEQIMVITGPNMAGKSVALRQVGLIVLMAQVGSFVPARAARVGIVDRIFTRVGASDNLAAGESTFLVEMNETANILNNATPRSLILLDEVGRGTSTFDGLSIAWALVEYLHAHDRVAARTLFATHFHELNDLADNLPRVRNYRVQVKEHGDKVIFLRKLVPGGADHSYGIEVARMAGLPTELISRARAILSELESQHLRNEPLAARGASDSRRSSVPVQIPLFDADASFREVHRELVHIDPNRMTPIEALMKLAELKEKAKGSS